MFSIIAYNGIERQDQKIDPKTNDPKKVAGLVLQVFLIVAAATLFTLAKTGALAGLHSFSWIQLPATEITSLTILALGGADALIAILFHYRKKNQTIPRNIKPPEFENTTNINNTSSASKKKGPIETTFDPPPFITIPHTKPPSTTIGKTVDSTETTFDSSSFITIPHTEPPSTTITVQQEVNHDSKRMLTDRAKLQDTYKETFTEPLKSLPLEQMQEFAFAYSALNLKCQSLENGNLKVIGSPENLHILGEILGVNLDSDVSEYIVTRDDQTYLASQAIYQLLSPEGQQQMCAALYSLLVPQMKPDDEYELRYLRTHSNQPITLGLVNTPTGTYLTIFTKSEKKHPINFSISQIGELKATDESLSYHIHEALITLLWHNIPLVIAEIDPKQSAEIPQKALGVIKALLADLDGTFAAATAVDYTKCEANRKEYGMCVPVGGGLPIYHIVKTSSDGTHDTFTGLTLEHPEDLPKLPHALSPQTHTIQCVFAKLYNPVVASQDCTFTYKIISKPNEPLQLSIEKDSEGRGGHFTNHAQRTLSFQTVRGNEEVVQVSIEKEDHGGDSMSGYSNNSCATYQVACNTDGQWQITSMGKISHTEDWFEQNSYMQNDDGTWSCVGESKIMEDRTTPEFKETCKDLDYILQCLITTYQLERSSHTLVMHHVGEHRVSNAKTSAACLELYAHINQGEAQGKQAVLRRYKDKLITNAGYALPYYDFWQDRKKFM